MKKILFATLMFLGVAVVSNAKPSAKTITHKKEATRPVSAVRSVSATTATSLTKAATDKAGKKHKKHKKHQKAPKNEPKK